MPVQAHNNYKVVAPSIPAYTAEWGLLKFLEPWNPEDMELAVKKDYPWDLSQHVDTIIGYAATELLKWFETYRPDLHRVLSTKEGLKYLKKQMKTALTPI